jgi:hypothetical protein
VVVVPSQCDDSLLMQDKLKHVKTILSSGREPTITSIYYRDRKCVEVYLHSHTTSFKAR